MHSSIFGITNNLDTLNPAFQSPLPSFDLPRIDYPVIPGFIPNIINYSIPGISDVQRVQSSLSNSIASLRDGIRSLSRTDDYARYIGLELNDFLIPQEDYSVPLQEDLLKRLSKTLKKCKTVFGAKALQGEAFSQVPDADEQTLKEIRDLINTTRSLVRILLRNNYKDAYKNALPAFLGTSYSLKRHVRLCPLA